MRIGVVGAGGAGGHFAARWVDSGHDVTVVARGEHGATIAERGLKLESPLGDTVAQPAVVAKVGDLPDVDLLVFATKSFQLAEAAREAARMRSPFMALGLQNGVTSTTVLRDALPQATVLGAICRVISLIESPGVIRHVGAHPTIVLGGEGETAGGSPEALARALTVPGQLTVEASDRIEFEIWSKFLFFAPISGVGSASGLSIGVLREDERWRGLLTKAIEEVATVADAVGIPLGEDAVTRTLAFVDTLPMDGTSSLQRDIAAGRPNELDELSGQVVRMGRELGIPTPAHATIMDHLS